MTQDKSSKIIHVLKSYTLITISIFIMAFGVYFFKFPNNFVFGGITGFAVVVAQITPLSASTFSFLANTALLVLGLLALGRSFAVKTTYASMLLSILLVVFEHVYPMDHPMSNEPMLELLFAIALPAIGSALLFYLGASSGGTDVIAMIIKKYTSMKDIGMALFITDLLMIIFACFVFDIKTALYSFVGLTVKSFLIDSIIENITLCKSIMIICDDPEPICKYITQGLNKGATIVDGQGAYTHANKHIVFTTLTRRQAIVLRNYIHENRLNAFISVSSTSEVFGNGFSNI